LDFRTSFYPPYSAPKGSEQKFIRTLRQKYDCEMQQQSNLFDTSERKEPARVSYFAGHKETGHFNVRNTVRSQHFPRSKGTIAKRI
ncbi:MAG TPA: hypothetical protein VGW76_16085, partial [Pyrinomonadaceae bacterium]|nr:hypothetical protein [Pyrinomonadaceae bacterium]